MPLQLRTEKHTKHYIEQLDRGREHWQTWCGKVQFSPNMEDIKELSKQVAKYADQLINRIRKASAYANMESCLFSSTIRNYVASFR